jgi:hypothetical protein
VALKIKGMNGSGIEFTAYPISGYVSIRAIRDAVSAASNDPDFDHEAWSIDDAEAMERLAWMIRQGYETEETEGEDIS